MKIAIDISQICYEGTGVANYTASLVTSLLKTDRTNEYMLVGTSFRGMEILKNFHKVCRRINSKVDAKFFPIPERMANIFGNRWHFPEITGFIGQVDIFHSSDWIQWKVNAKKITTIHDLVIFRYPELSDPYIVQTQKERLNWIKKECDMVIADSEATKKDMVNILKFDPDKTDVVYPGIEEIYERVCKSEIERVKNKYELTDDYILAVGTVEPRKNINRVISAFDLFSKHTLVGSLNKPIQLVVAGKRGWEKDITPVKGLKMLGLVDKIDLPALYSGASLFVYPSLYEGFGLPVLEAMSCGCPVITSDRGSLREVAGDGAEFVEPENVRDISAKMVRIFIDRETREKLVKRGLEQSLKFSWTNTAGEMKAIYEKLSAKKQ